MHRLFSKIGALIAMTSVIIGAFGTHYLKNLLSAQELASLQTATFYQFIHAIGLFLVANQYRYYRKKQIEWSGNLMLIGIILFSGSIYLRIFLVAMGNPNVNALNLITPLGGLSLIISWLLLFFGIPAYEYHESKKSEED